MREEQIKINIVDAIYRSGKTAAAINMINTSDDNQKFLYIVDYLEDAERIIKQCPNKCFKHP